MSDSQSKKIKKRKNSQIQTNRGKPSDIQSTQLSIPDIWTNHPVCLKLIKYLLDNGRHNCLHQAGKQTNKNDYKSKKCEIKKNKEFYTQLESIAKELFGYQCETKRCIVFFFRSNEEEKLANDNWIQNFHQYNQDCVEALFKIKALFNEKFFNNLILILSSNQTQDQLIQQLLQNSETPQQFSQIIQNIYIKYILEQMKEQQSCNVYTFRNRAAIEDNFFSFIKSNSFKIELEKFIRDIKFIFNRENDQYHGSVIQFQETNDLSQLFIELQNSTPWFYDQIQLHDQEY
ncbi:unnamed protein product [Paramecium sonneborni]|uniref:Uncharacterized protein n=1 Tax=Paramecium sonneborni TaxID=65129 RepID=A0A8S1M0M8_9CILI|nr:unnamed protein product [Paramecium sonneborni]